MLKIAITGSLSSGKSTVSKIISKKRYPVFDADVEVKNFYKDYNNIKAIRNKFRIKDNKNIKTIIKEKLCTTSSTTIFLVLKSFTQFL